MTTTYKQLKQAADNLDKQADALESAAGVLEDTQKKLAQAQKAAAEHTKTAAAQESVKAELAPMAKTAAAALLESNLLSTQEQADVFASQILGDHKVALAKMAQLAKHSGAPKRAQVVHDSQTPEQETSDGAWEKHARAALQRLHLG